MKASKTGKMNQEKPSAVPAAGFAMAMRFDDSDALAEAVRGWDLDFRQLDRGRIVARLGHVATGGVLMTECGLTRRMEQHGAPPSGFRTFAIPSNDAMKVRWRGTDHSGENLMLFRPGSDLDSISDSRFHVFTVSIEEELLASAAGPRGLTSFEQLDAGSDVIACSDPVRYRLRQLAADLMETAMARPDRIGDPSFRQALEGELVGEILDTVVGSPAIKKRPMARTRSRVLRKAVEIINDRAHEPVSISEVEQLSGASTRTLRYAFQESFGVSPKQYLQAFRLNRVRRQLRETRQGVESISEVANAWGFWHMGQFAKDYRKMFGELPSGTLARSARTGKPGAGRRVGS